MARKKEKQKSAIEEYLEAGLYVVKKINEIIKQEGEKHEEGSK